MTIQGTIATKNYIKQLRELIKAKEGEGLSAEAVLDAVKEKLEKDNDGWS